MWPAMAKNSATPCWALAGNSPMCIGKPSSRIGIVRSVCHHCHLTNDSVTTQCLARTLWSFHRHLTRWIKRLIHRGSSLADTWKICTDVLSSFTTTKWDTVLCVVGCVCFPLPEVNFSFRTEKMLWEKALHTKRQSRKQSDAECLHHLFKSTSALHRSMWMDEQAPWSFPFSTRQTHSRCTEGNVYSAV